MEGNTEKPTNAANVVLRDITDLHAKQISTSEQEHQVAHKIF